MNSKSAYVAICLMFGTLMCGTPALSQDACDAILKTELMNQSEIVDKQSASSAVTNSFCSMSYSEASSSSNQKVAAQYKIIFKGAASQGKENFEKWKNENCGSSSSSQTSDQFRFEAQKALSTKAIEAWEKCVTNRDDLTCIAKPNSDSDLITIAVYWRHAGSNVTRVKSSVVRGGRNLSDRNNPGQLFAKNELILEGSDNVLIERLEKKNITATLSVATDGGTVDECSVFNAYVDMTIAPPNSPPVEITWSNKLPKLASSFYGYECTCLEVGRNNTTFQSIIVGNQCGGTSDVLIIKDETPLSIDDNAFTLRPGREFAMVAIPDQALVRFDSPEGGVVKYMPFTCPPDPPSKLQLTCLIKPSELPPGAQAETCAKPGNQINAPCSCPKVDQNGNQLGISAGSTVPTPSSW